MNLNNQQTAVSATTIYSKPNIILRRATTMGRENLSATAKKAILEGTFFDGEQTQQIPPGTFHGGEQTQQIPPGTFHGGKRVQRIIEGTFMAIKKGSSPKMGKFTEPIRCRGYHCGKVFYTEYVNGFSWECPYCGTIH